MAATTSFLPAPVLCVLSPLCWSCFPKQNNGERFLCTIHSSICSTTHLSAFVDRSMCWTIFSAMSQWLRIHDSLHVFIVVPDRFNVKLRNDSRLGSRRWRDRRAGRRKLLVFPAAERWRRTVETPWRWTGAERMDRRGLAMEAVRLFFRSSSFTSESNWNNSDETLVGLPSSAEACRAVPYRFSRLEVWRERNFWLVGRNSDHWEVYLCMDDGRDFTNLIICWVRPNNAMVYPPWKDFRATNLL